MSPGFSEEPRRSIDLTKVPNEPWFRSAFLLSRGVEAASAQAAEWVAKEYPGRERLERAIRFADWHLAEGARGDFDALNRVWFFPWTEASHELALAFACALGGLHRAAVDHHRRALELCVVGAYFVSEHVSAEEGSKWYTSDNQTPFFTRALDRLAKTGFCQEVDGTTSWLLKVKTHYWHLSDIAHVRGQKYSLFELSRSMFSLSGFPMPSFRPESLTRSLDLFIESCSYAAAALAVANPALLVGMPLPEKYGENPPIGFFTENQADALAQMLPDSVREGFVAAAQADERVRGIREYMESLPDITEEEILRQIEDLKL